MSDLIVGSIENPFLKAQARHIAAGTVAIESERAIAEAQGKLVIAKRFPRDEAAAFARAMDACRRPSLAAVANYAFPRAGQSVSGPSIRLAEELARCWGNLDYGLRELSRRDGESEMEAYAWDLETNVMSSQKFTARHIRDKKGGGEKLHEERDIYELTANLGSRRLRARILAILPPDLVDAAVSECRATMSGKNTKPLADQIRAVTQAFAKLGVTAEMLATRLGHQLDDTTPDEVADLREIYASLKDGMSKASEWFGTKETIAAAPEKPASKLDALEAAAPEPEKAAEASEKDAEWLSTIEAEFAAAPTVQAVEALAAMKPIRNALSKAPQPVRDRLNAIVKAALDRVTSLVDEDDFPGTVTP